MQEVQPHAGKQPFTLAWLNGVFLAEYEKHIYDVVSLQPYERNEFFFAEESKGGEEELNTVLTGLAIS